MRLTGTHTAFNTICTLDDTLLNKPLFLSWPTVDIITVIDPETFAVAATRSGYRVSEEEKKKEEVAAFEQCTTYKRDRMSARAHLVTCVVVFLIVYRHPYVWYYTMDLMVVMFYTLLQMKCQ